MTITLLFKVTDDLLLLLFSYYNFSGFTEATRKNEKNEDEDYNLSVIGKNIESFLQIQVGNHLQIKVFYFLLSK